MNSNQNTASMQIALDGPSASGKSTVGAMLAERLGCSFLDTGMMYRAVTYLTIKNRISTKDFDSVHNGRCQHQFLREPRSKRHLATVR